MRFDDTKAAMIDYTDPEDCFAAACLAFVLLVLSVCSLGVIPAVALMLYARAKYVERKADRAAAVFAAHAAEAQAESDRLMIAGERVVKDKLETSYVVR
jgi:hypothetical protein